ncbi:MAG: DUF434 domain-containing protein [Desulfarculaceae bacterium]|nr:DUF434 domain-containing protein [Desulfarculaceae bacterium]MCF8073844.1 DUF434 domain-containing protein [Desulfarculaceae bacterium]MCF8102824.1 DUF434 domain-containing protein [Desulfarculaceae bacterium]MCF8116268.1 DUF434 domain-containing protein [Desulfarculaceae bacterium]
MSPLDQTALRQAARDMRYLLARGYPRELGLKLTGDRWGLDAPAREVLRRGAFAPREAEARRARLLPLSAAAGQAVGVDGHNVLITLESALSGAVLVAADDGVIRDIGQRGRHFGPSQATQQAAGLMMDALAGAGAGEVLILLDAPLSKSGELAAGLRAMLARAGMAGQARAVAAPDRELAAFGGLVASGDSMVIDAAARPLDLAGSIIRNLEPRPFLTSLEETA